MAVFSTTVSSVIRPVPRPVWVGEPSPFRSICHCDGSLAVAVPLPLNSALRAKTGLLLFMFPSVGYRLRDGVGSFTLYNA